jgi:hypothetical protein
MPGQGDYILVTFVDQQDSGKHFVRSRNIWPLHITVVGWFSIDHAGFTEFEEDLHKIAGTFAAKKLMVGSEALFGENNEVVVNTLSDSEYTHSIHSALLHLVTQHGGRLVDSRWIGADYSAHITHHGDVRCHEGDLFLYDHVQLVRLQAGGVCEIGTRFNFKAAQ